MKEEITTSQQAKKGITKYFRPFVTCHRLWPIASSLEKVEKRKTDKESVCKERAHQEDLYSRHLRYDKVARSDREIQKMQIMLFFKRNK